MRRMDLSKLKNKCDLGSMPNVVIILETFQNALAQDFNKRIDEMGETWKETKDAVGNMKVATKEVMRVRGDTARRIEEKEFWKQVRIFCLFRVMSNSYLLGYYVNLNLVGIKFKFAKLVDLIEVP